jgi:anaerobic selenocysteine-containing dehydrogenase
LYNNILHFNKITDLIYNISSDYIYNVNFKDKFIISHAFFINNDVFNVSDLILPITAPYEMENVFINLEGKTKLMKQNIKSFFSVYTD